MYDNTNYFRLAFEVSSVGMAFVGLDGRFLEVNKSLCKMCEYSEEELLARRFHDITYPDDLQPDVDLVNKCLSGEINEYNLEKRYITKNKEIVWILLTVSIIRDLEKKPVVFIAHMQNITEIKLYKERLNTALSNWGIGIWAWYADKDQLIWDKTMFEIYETLEEEFVPNYAFFNKFVHPDDRADVAKELEHAVASKKDFKTKFRIICKDHSYKWIAGRGRVSVDSLGNIFMVTGINFDVSKEVEEETKIDMIAQIITSKISELEKNNGKESKEN